MVHGVFGGEEGRGHVVVTVFDLNLQVRIIEKRLHQVVFGQSGVAGQLFGHVRFFRGGQFGAFHQGGSVFIFRELARFFDESRQIFGAILQDFVIPGGGGIAGQIKDVGQVRTGMEGDGAEIEYGGDQVDAVEVHAVMGLQVVSESGGTEGAVTLADEEFGRVPATVAVYVHGDELRQGFYVLIDAPKVFVLRFAYGMAEACADRVDEDHIGFIEQRALIVLQLVGRRRSVFGVRGDDAARSEGAHVQPNGRGTGAAVVDERDGALGGIFAIGADVGGGID